MGLELPPELRQWLLAHDLDTDWRAELRETLVERGCDVPVPGGHLLLGFADIERVHLHRIAVERMDPSGDPHCPWWRPEWVPMAAERDAELSYMSLGVPCSEALGGRQRPVGG
ncbi:hypothetical protein ACIGXI_25910 [Kitasatospora aureofaciens]|uniref:hypothetical protein n=1 Tax=Kitasatospora aureofaciens TaxID=1894 RepID=UPI0037C7771A